MEDLNFLETGTVAEIQISYHPKVKPFERPIVRTSEEVDRLFRLTWDYRTFEFVEQFKIMLLNRANRVIGICLLTSGNIAGTIADPKLVFAVGLKANASNIILAHNHPSGNLLPSDRDIQLTKTMKEAGKLLELKIIDHVILTTEGYFSFSDQGAL